MRNIHWRRVVLGVIDPASATSGTPSITLKSTNPGSGASGETD
jgi:hypothetical protein